MADNDAGPGSPALAAFPGLTVKQHEVLRYVAENRTSKEIAFELGISESAVNQRIESIRNRTGSPPRAELARAYRQYLQEQENACNPPPAKITQVPAGGVSGDLSRQNEAVDRLALADAVTFRVSAPWQEPDGTRVVPEVLDGAHAGLSRTAAMIAIAVGLLLVAMVGLGVARALSDLF